MTEIEQIIQTLNLEKHCEGGYFRRTYCSTIECTNSENKPRFSMSSIYYLVTAESGISVFAINKSDLMLYHHQGAALKIVFIEKDGSMREETLGSNLNAGHTPQVFCPAGTWKAYDLMGAEYALVSEAVTPSFEYEDMHMPTFEELKQKSPQHAEQLRHYILR
ncbi:MAG: cupin domain-containing protein [Coxiellaceae bacterium]|nr:cupin domain-containing protein [Coxiellaceae bacterium]